MQIKRQPNSSPYDRTHQRKRMRQLKAVNEAEILAREAEEDTALEVDLMILDHCAYISITGLLDASSFRSQERLMPDALQRSLSMFQSWHEYFRDQWPAVRGDAHLRFRLALLRFLTLFHRRLIKSYHTPALAELAHLRCENISRVLTWIDDEERVPTRGELETSAESFLQQGPVELSRIDAHRVRVLEAFGETRLGSQFYGSPASVSLLDLMPSFMQLCASAAAIHDCRPNVDGLPLLVNFIRQACLEQYLVYGATNLDTFDQAFAWGCYEKRPEVRRSADYETDRMFRAGDDNDLEIEEWHNLKDQALRELLTSIPGESKTQRLERLAEQYSIVDFDMEVRSFLTDLSTVIPISILAQVERGQLDGKTEEETAMYLELWAVA